MEPGKINEIIKRLERRFGRPKLKPRMDPLSELIFTILSQNTSDINRDRAFANLRAAFPRWGLLLEASISQIIKAIRAGGLANIKAGRIKELLLEIKARYGRLSLAPLKTLPLAEIKKSLLSFKGVGPKTAACVILFSLSKPAFPVDTHIFRITRRLGMVPLAASPEKAHEIMEKMVPTKKYYSFHINLIKLGRAICLSRKPRCEICPLKELCCYYQNRIQDSD